MNPYHKTATSGFVCLLAFLCGTMITHQIHFFLVFDGALFMDWAILTGTAGIAAAAGYRYLRIKPFYLLASQIGVLCLSAIAFELSFMTYGMGQVASFTPYFIIFASGMVLGLSLNELEDSGHAWYLIISALLIAGMVAQYLLPNRFWNNFFVVIGLLLLVLRSYPAVKRRQLLLFTLSLPLVIIAMIYNNTAIPHESQHRYYDKVVYSKSNPFQQIDVTEWKGNYWFYYNHVNQFSSIDEWLYAEPMAHPVMTLSESPGEILLIGGENGIIAREILKHPVRRLDIIPIDFELIREAVLNRFFTNVNKHALRRDEVEIQYTDAFRYLHANEDKYDVILIDIPDPLDVGLNQYYTREFYELCYGALRENGLLVTQAGSPYFATKAFMAIEKTIAAANFATLPLHNQVLSLGEWGWVIGAKSMDKALLLSAAKKLTFKHLDTRWINNEAMQLLVSFGKPYVTPDSIAINTIKNPVIHGYYKSGTWNF